MGGFTHWIILEPWAAEAYPAVEANCSEHGKIVILGVRGLNSYSRYHINVHSCSHATADVRIALRYQCLGSRVHSQASALDPLGAQKPDGINDGIFRGILYLAGTWRYRHGIDRHAYPQRQPKQAQFLMS